MICNGPGDTDLSWTSEHACMEGMEGYISKSGVKDLDRPDRGSLEVRCMWFMDSVGLSPQANSMCLRNREFPKHEIAQVKAQLQAQLKSS